jgi:subtilisin family serine protease
MLVLTSNVFAMAPITKSPLKVESVKGELIVKLKNPSLKSVQMLSKLGVTVSREVKLSYGSLHVVKVNSQKSMKNAITDLKNSDLVEFAEPNFIYRIAGHKVEKSDLDLNLAAPSDPMFGQLWGLKNTGTNEPKASSAVQGTAGADIDALRAWEITKGSRNVKIAIIDTGIDYNHPDIKNNIWTNTAELNGKAGVDDDKNGFIDDLHGWDFANKDNDPLDGHGHGTHCSGTIGAPHDNGVGVAGVMSEVTFVAVKFLSDAGSGTLEDAVLAIDYATKLNVDIMSNSWGGGGFSEALKQAIQRASDAGIVFTAAAGNDSADNDNSPHYPSSYDLPNVIAVAAHTIGDALADFSCYGKRSVLIAAPGHNILSTVKNGGYDVYSGTSMATPHVSGVIGLLISKEGRLAHADLRARLVATSTPVRAYRRKTVSGGRINAYNLLTDTRPERNEPNPGAWRSKALSEKVETLHPYGMDKVITKTFTVAGAKYLRLKIKKYQTEAGYDFISIKDKNGQVAEQVSGRGENYSSEYVEGDTITISFTSDNTIDDWGFLVEELEFIAQ